ncbi:hypothetical protein BH23BAC1_BH23BAC1_44050 [soil metagenome]
MQNDLSFLPYFFTEPVYIIPEASVPENSVEALPHQNLEKPSKKLPSKGNFGKKVLLIVDDPEDEVLNPSESGFLNKILKAIKLTEEDIIILNVHHITDEQLPEVLSKFPYKVLISFGVNSEALLGTSNVLPYIIPKGQERVRLLVDNLPAIEKDQQKKVKLWENLQLLFVRN